LVLRPPSMVLRRLAVINRFSTCWPQSHVLYLCRQEVLGRTHKVLQSYSTSSLVLGLSLVVLRPTSQRLITVTANEIPSIESLSVSDAEPYTTEVHAFTSWFKCDYNTLITTFGRGE